ncbi:1-acyl-sn-glycerol-3-phosphate acyltransferase [Oceanobacillus sp. J11TS1]|uniref:lysophospholipid acyltransferase family protein n=1 Tax=Oceanobacillus sp. J11TS1 TaxID=2807191 RepID=UPI001B22E0AF|nr:1-acyl-sn-glycerol-3-phosphate acyltransferase [Oceanobacillus sp. J11TS1]GIO24365.1 1-acyl-sn-glycerol-3-phosphate acyltransferase [Oceanobacillus sp. J11TS1]
MYYFAAYALKIVLSLFGRVNVFQKEKLPASGGYIIACTHTGWIDILWLGVSVLPTKVHYMAKKELFESRPLKWLMKKLNAFPVDRDNPGPSTIKVPRKLLKQEKVIGIFPSGTRTTNQVPLKRGAVTIAAYSNVPIIPAAYIGPNNFKELFKRKKPKIIFGDPIHLPADMPRKEAMDEMMNVMNEKLYALQSELEQK